ncbi:MAG TPA: hypothetical protein VN923_13970, partial [Thermoanaerobaculia bacterium]|nr:hypothetical protein [Thermoanaerobaculia bacterium]
MRPTTLLAPLSLALAAFTFSACAGGTAPTSAPEAAPAATAAPAPTPEPTPPPLTVVPDVEARVAQFARTPLTADISNLPASETKALGESIAAARYLDDIYLRQVWGGNPALR